MPHRVFISHSTQDKWTADAACGALEDAGIQCWIAPRDILPSQSWAEAIVEAIGASSAVLVILSSSSIASDQVRREVERAASKGIAILPFRIEDVSPSGSLEYFLSSPHWLDAIAPPLEPHLRQMVSVVSTLLGRDESNMARPPSEVHEPEALEELAPDDWFAPKSRVGRLMRRMLDDR